MLIRNFGRNCRKKKYGEDIFVWQNTDVSLLSTISFPAFATHDEAIYERTKNRMVRYEEPDIRTLWWIRIQEVITKA